MSSVLVDTSSQAGNPNKLLADMADSAAERAALNQRADAQAGDTGTRHATTFEEPERFKNKSREEVLESYINLERRFGALGNEVGGLRQSVAQLQTTRQEPVVKATVEMTDLLEKPTETLETFIRAQTAATEQAANARIAQIEQQLKEQSFLSKHGDYQQVLNDGSFADWAHKTTYRTNLAQAAAGGNWEAADAILSEYKEYRPQANVQRATNSGLEAARRAGLEGSNTGSSGSSGKRFHANDIHALRTQNPDKYNSDAFQAELLRAYAENRVDR